MLRFYPPGKRFYVSQGMPAISNKAAMQGFLRANLYDKFLGEYGCRQTYLTIARYLFSRGLLQLAAV